MREVIQFINGRAYKKEELLSNGKYKVLRVGNFFTNNSWYYSDLELPEDKYCNNGDLLYAWSASFGPKIWKGDKTIFHYHIWNLKYSEILFRDYLYYYLLFDKTQVKKSTTGSTMIHVSMENMNPRLIPIPPINEQRRIVTKIESVIPIVDKYETSQILLNQLNTEIFDKLKKSVLQEAIQGKLVPQDPNDEPASVLLERIKEEKTKLFKEGKLKKKDLVDSVIFKGDDNKYYEKIGSQVACIDDEIPFEIPSNWQWVRLGKVTIVNPRNTISDEMSVGFIPMTNISPGYGNSIECEQRYWKDVKSGFTHIAEGDVAFAKITPCFQNRKSFIAANLPNGFAAGTTELNVLRPYDNTIDTRYLLWFLKSEYFISEAKFKGTAGQQRVVIDYVLNRLFPLPPVKEQIRISNHLEFVIASIMRR
ncbi:MAG: restriction endonuclease subunit S [Bacteroidaceae bacterium]|nr:restriction endonuclease subunit S [Bacteroidaceae bacterium]